MIGNTPDATADEPRTPASRWGVSATRESAGASRVFSRELQRGIEVSESRGHAHVVVGFVVDGAVSVSRRDAKAHRIDSGGAFVLWADVSYAFEWHRISRVTFVVVSEADVEHLGVTEARAFDTFRSENALVSAVGAFMEAVASSRGPENERSRMILDRLIRRQIGALLLSEAPPASITTP